MGAGLFRFLFCFALICAVPLKLPGTQSDSVHRQHERKHHFVHLRWRPPVHSPDKVVGYSIYRSADGGSTFRKLNARAIHRPMYIDYTVRSGKTYLYEVKSVDAKGRESKPSNRITLKVP